MAAGKSGIIELTSKGFTLKVSWSETYDTATNMSKVSIDNLHLKTQTEAGVYMLDGTIKIAGTTVITFNSAQGYHNIYVNADNVYQELASHKNPPPWSKSDIVHDSDGNKSVTIDVNVSGSGARAWWSVSGSESVKLTAIPRASEITSIGNVTLGNACSVKWTPKSASFRYKLKFSLGSWSHITGAIHPNKITEYTYNGYTIPLEVARQIPNAKTAIMTVELCTYSDSGATVQVGSVDSATFTVTVPDNSSTKPAVTMTLAPVSSLPGVFEGLYVQGKTKVKAELRATGKYDSTISSYSMKAENETYASDDSYTSRYLTAAGSITVYGYAKDSRGFTGSASEKITVIGYSKPKILPVSGETEVVAARCDSDGNLTDSGTYLKIKAKRSYSPVESGGVQKNFCAIQYRYKLESASDYSAWTTILAADSLASDEVETSAMLGGVLSVQHTYLVQVRAVDDIGESGFTTLIIPTDTVYMHRARNAMGLGKYCERENAIDSGWDLYMNRNRVTGLPTPIDSSDAVPKSYVDKAVQTALAEAKASGEFDGAPGYTPQKGKDYFTAEEVEAIKSELLASLLQNRRVSYIEVDGTEYIDTGYKPNQNTRLVMDANFTKTASNQWLFCGRTGTNNDGFGFFYSSSKFGACFGDEQEASLSDMSVTTSLKIDFNKNKLTFNDVTHTFTSQTFKSNGNLVLLARNTNGTVAQYANARMYSCKIYDNGKLVRDYIPVQVEDEFGLYERVEGKFYGNAGTGNIKGA